MTVAKLRSTLHDRVSHLEKRSEVHDKMAEQFDEIYEAWKGLKAINWFVVKVLGWSVGGVGGLAAVLTIVEKAVEILKH